MCGGGGVWRVNDLLFGFGQTELAHLAFCSFSFSEFPVVRVFSSLDVKQEERSWGSSVPS